MVDIVIILYYIAYLRKFDGSIKYQFLQVIVVGLLIVHLSTPATSTYRSISDMDLLITSIITK
jgi:hypothetical protein